MRKRFRSILRRLIIWAVADPEARRVSAPVYRMRLDIEASQVEAEEMFIRGASTPNGRKVIVNTLQRAKINREL